MRSHPERTIRFMAEPCWKGKITVGITGSKLDKEEALKPGVLDPGAI